MSEDVLYELGFIHDFNKYRLVKLQKKSEGVCNSLREYGLDGMCRIFDNADNNYYGIQAKCWNKNKVTANDIGSFTSVIYRRLVKKNSNNGGYLYHSGKLEINLYEDLLNDPTIRMTKMPLIKEEVVSENYDESLYELKPFQREALSKMNEGWEKNGLLSLPSGTGKTLIMGNYLKQRRLGMIIVLSPTKILTQQNLNRLSKFLPDYMPVLVDSEGTRSTDYLQSLIDKQKKRLLLSSTYRSIDIIGDLDFSSYGGDDALLCIDECHNITNEIHDFIDVFPGKVLQLSATPIEILEEDSCQYDLQTIYHLEFSRAIREKYITDYMIYIPSFLDTKSGLYVDIPDLDGYYAPRAEFLVCGMLRKGYRRCIVYLNTINDCRVFVDTIRRVFEDYHGEKFWGGIITENVSERDRQNILNDFSSKDNLETYRIIASIRILDEGLDIPCCDSIYFAQPSLSKSDYNYRRTIQRLCRATRIDSDNTNKVAGCFIFCDDYNETVNIMDMLKNNDLKITNKINAIILNYDKSNQHETNIVEYEKKESFNKYITSIKNIDEIWLQRYNLLQNFIRENKRLPKSKEIYSSFKIGSWIFNQRSKMKNTTLKQDRKEKLELLNLWKWDNDDDWILNYNLLQKYICERNKIPASDEIYNNIKIGSWISNQKTYMKNGTLKHERFEKLDKITNWTWDRDVIWHNKYNLLRKYINLYGKLPDSINKIFENVDLLEWCKCQRKEKSNNNISLVRIKKLEEINCWSWNLRNDSWNKQFEILKEYINNNKSLPKPNTLYKDIDIYKWSASQRERKANNKLSKNRQIQLEGLKDWFWTEKKKKRHPWNYYYNLLIEYTSKNNKLPPMRCKVFNVSLGDWFQRQKKLIKDGKIDDEKKDLINNIINKYNT